MRKTSVSSSTVEPISVDIRGLMTMLGCGEQTARRIAKKAEAKLDLDGRRSLYSTAKIREYIANHTI